MKQAKLATPPVAQINVRIERSLKDEGDAVLAEAGISPSQIVRDLWGKIAQRGDALDEVMKTLGSEGRSHQEQEAIDAKLAVLDRMTRRRDELARNLGLSAASMPVYPDGYDWRERVQSERDRKRGRRGIQ
ncbi:MAG: type II toxin-antitoxin system RelB/DinJ family antitoxin [Atopobiaceae bacterium]|nr:type II toxin-antitoxin system RelB/DinJ family antitoxin [Atopobiaceae bacterium]